MADLTKVKKFELFFGPHPYEVRFGRDGQGYFYEIVNLEKYTTVDAQDGLTREGFIAAVGCALEPWQLRRFEELVFSLG